MVTKEIKAEYRRLQLMKAEAQSNDLHKEL